jgi:hypothetical protein
MMPLEDLTDDPFSQRVQQAVRLLPDAPLAWQEAAFRLLASKPGVRAGAVAALGRLVHAVLSFDSWAAPALAPGMRSQHSTTRHLLYSAEARDVDLRITPMAEHFALSWQVLGPDESGVVELVTQGGGPEGSYRGSLDALGTFRIDGVPCGRYLLTLHLSQGPIVVEVLEVGEPAP